MPQRRPPHRSPEDHRHWPLHIHGELLSHLCDAFHLFDDVRIQIFVDEICIEIVVDEKDGGPNQCDDDAPQKFTISKLVSVFTRFKVFIFY